MKQASIVIDRDQVEEIMREHLEIMFPTMEIASIYGLGYGDVTITLRRPATVEPAPIDEPQF